MTTPTPVATFADIPQSIIDVFFTTDGYLNLELADEATEVQKSVHEFLVANTGTWPDGEEEYGRSLRDAILDAASQGLVDLDPARKYWLANQGDQPTGTDDAPAAEDVVAAAEAADAAEGIADEPTTDVTDTGEATETQAADAAATEAAEGEDAPAKAAPKRRPASEWAKRTYPDLPELTDEADAETEAIRKQIVNKQGRLQSKHVGEVEVVRAVYFFVAREISPYEGHRRAKLSRFEEAVLDAAWPHAEKILRSTGWTPPTPSEPADAPTEAAEGETADAA